MICTPLGTYAALAEAIAPGLKPGAIVTDAGSTKDQRDPRPRLPACRRACTWCRGTRSPVPSIRGPEAGFAELFAGRFCILTPPPGTDPAALETVRALWQGMGMTVHEMTAEHHDRVLAITSHLPHLIAYCIVGTATDWRPRRGRR